MAVIYLVVHCKPYCFSMLQENYFGGYQSHHRIPSAASSAKAGNDLTQQVQTSLPESPISTTQETDVPTRQLDIYVTIEVEKIKATLPKVRYYVAMYKLLTGHQ